VVSVRLLQNITPHLNVALHLDLEGFAQDPSRISRCRSFSETTRLAAREAASRNDDRYALSNNYIRRS
jgi:hypothetical protein